MKNWKMFVLLLILSQSMAFAQYLDYKMHHGDLLVYEEAGTKRTSIVRLSGYRYDTDIINGELIDTATVFVYKSEIGRYFEGILWSQDNPLYMSIDLNGIVYQKSPGALGFRQMYPTSLPIQDTIYLHYQRANIDTMEASYNYRAFDTVIYGEKVNAISFLHVHGDTLSFIIVTDLFGYIRIQNEFQDWRLSSAEIAGVKYNRDMRKFAAFPTCSGSKFVYEVNVIMSASGKQHWYNYYELEDTLVGGSWYYKAIDPGDLLWHSTANAPFRVQDGIFYTYNDTGETMHDTTASIGASMNGTIIDTSVRDVFGKQRRTLQHDEPSHYAAARRLWAEGIGLIEREEHDIGYHVVTTLVYANICGEEFGTPVGVEQLLPLAASASIISVHTNPVSLSQGVVQLTLKQALRGPMQITIYDALGRKVHAESAMMNNSGNMLQVPLNSISPGIYYLTITGKNINETTKLVVVR